MTVWNWNTIRICYQYASNSMDISYMFVLKQEYPGCQVFGQTVTTNHHEELIKLGISPSLKWTEAKHKFPYVIFCAPPHQSSDYPGDLR